MTNLTISIINNKIFPEILKEADLFSEFKIRHYDNLNFLNQDVKKVDQIIVYFYKETDINNSIINKIYNFPLILISESLFTKSKLSSELVEQVKIPFSILEFKKKLISLIAKNEFKKNSLITLDQYTIDKNERKIKKNELELQLSEKEINFLILFSKNKEPISRNLVLKTVWNYSSESETHTVETHIHRLRKKILEKFGDDNFIKNNNKGYYI
tara:strand:- start:593 stop:1231 length:639 start_codon:yes stop_codon:yes gene_type:complete